jgi:cytidyltransferase-like protein
MSIHYPVDPKIVSYQQACELIKQAHSRGLGVTFAQGVFDVLHIGHTKFLQEAKETGDILFVGLEPDESVRMNKGSSRPLNPIEERLQLIAALQCVNYVFPFEDAIPYGPAGTALYTRRLGFLKPDKLALAIGDSLLDLRRANAISLGIQPAIVRGIWREYSTTKLINSLN